MTKTEAIRLLGGSPSSAAQAVGCTPQAIAQWPDPLPARIRDRVHAALWRAHVATVASASKPDATVAATPDGAASQDQPAHPVEIAAAV